MSQPDQLNRRLPRDSEGMLDGNNLERFPLTDDGPDLERQATPLGRDEGEDDVVPEFEKTNYAGLTPSNSQQDLIFRKPYRTQSKRMSEVIRSRTELHSVDPTTPDPPAALAEEEDLSGLAYWLREASTAKEHGGDYSKRHDAALRAALGGFAVFSVLVFPHQQILGCVWIAAIFMHANVKNNFGESWESSKGFAFSILATSKCCVLESVCDLCRVCVSRLS